MSTSQQVMHRQSLNQEPGTFVPGLHRRRIRQGHTRRGSAMVWFAVSLFAIFGFAALVADLGQVFVVRRQMQSVANTAALEGLHLRNSVPSQTWLTAYHDTINSYLAAHNAPELTTATASSLTPADLDGIRRWAAALAGQQVLSYSATQIGVKSLAFDGSGIPVIGSDGATTSFQASELIAGVTSLYNGLLQPNLVSDSGNLANGDMVAGQYTTATQSHQEYSNYHRDDFQAATSNQTVTNSFLVRLRMTNGPITQPGLDNEAGIASTGTTSPYLFRRANGVNANDASTSWNNMAQGITVRATSIADARPVMTVGKRQPYTDADGNPQEIAGLLTIATNYSFELRADWSQGSSTTSAWYSTLWQPQPTADSTPTTQTVSVTINSTSGAIVAAGGATTLGQVITAPTNDFLTIGASSLTPTTLSAATLVTGSLSGIVPLVSTISTGDAVIGFAQVTLSSANGTTFTLARSFNEIATPGSRNAFGNLLSACSTSALSNLSADDSHLLMQARDQLLTAAQSTTTQAFPLLAPALVRATDVATPISP